MKDPFVMLWIAVALIGSTVAAGIAAVNWREAAAKEAMAQRGASAIEIRCAFANMNDSVCIAYGAKQGQK